MNIFTIFDTKAKAYLQPFFSRNKATALREVTQVVNTPDHSFNIHCEDYGLFQLGEYDEKTGKIESYPPIHIANLIELKTFDDRQSSLPITEEKTEDDEK